MSVHCPPSPTYHTSVEQKIRSKQFAKQFQFGSPKLRDLLREKCRVRVREARRASFDSKRSTGEIGQNTLVSKILRQELADLESDINIQEHIYRELIDEVNMWFVDQLEEEEQYLIDFEENDVVFCPVCQKNTLEQSNEQQMSCQCGVLFEHNGSLEELSMKLQGFISQHELNCSMTLNFFIEQNSNGKHILNSLCEKCDFFVSLT